ncbi:MAG: hypothetical protein M3X11_16500 [Acidobacteriota bacterium]|nr:hypothetical protein [Acidobacteriota bacterium]
MADPDFYQFHESFLAKPLRILIKCSAYGTLICVSLFCLLLTLSRISSWISTGEMQHSNEVLNTSGGHAGKFAAEFFAALCYGVMFGLPASVLLGLTASISYAIYLLVKFYSHKSSQLN